MESFPTERSSKNDMHLAEGPPMAPAVSKLGHRSSKSLEEDRLDKINHQVTAMLALQEKTVNAVELLQADVSHALTFMQHSPQVRNSQGGAFGTPSFHVAFDKSLAATAVNSHHSHMTATPLSPHRNYSQTSSSDGQKGSVLPMDWPRNLKKRRGLDLSVQASVRQLDLAREVQFIKALRKSQTEGALSAIGNTISRLQRIIVLCAPQDPNSKFIVAFELLALLAFINDIFITPYAIAWDLELKGTILWLQCIAALYWTLAIFVSLRTGYYKNGELKLGSGEVACNYVRGTFMVDLGLVIMDWLVLFSQGEDFNLIKVMRVFKVLRLIKVMIILDKYMEMTLPDAKLQIRFAEVVFGTIIVNHVMCCFWYVAGTSGFSDTGHHWLDTWLEQREGDHPGNVFQYLTSFHWSIAQLTGGSVEISPTNSLERGFTISLLILGMMFNATIVSLISSQTMDWVSRRAERREMISTLSRFLEQHHVDKPLQRKAMRQLIDRLSGRSTVLSEKEVRALNVIATGLRSEILRVTRRPQLLKHTLFKVWQDTSKEALQRLCDFAVKVCSVKPQDVVFQPGMPSGDTYVVMHGSLRYMQDADSSFIENDLVTHVQQDAWISEAAMWCYWVHVGKLEADGICHLLTIAAVEVLQALSRFPDVAPTTRAYGRAFYLRIITATPPFSQWPNDLHVPFTSPSDLMSDQFSIELLRREMENGLQLSHEDLESLHAEIHEGRSALQTNRMGQLERVAFVMAVHLKREADRSIWVQLGTVVGGQVKAACALPGRKRLCNEIAEEAYARLLDEWLAPFTRGIEVTTAVEEEEVKDSETYRLQTRYLRVVQHATLRAEFEEPPLAVAACHWKSAQTPSKRRISITVEGDSGIRDALSNIEVYALSSRGSVRLFAWLSPDEYHMFTSFHGQEDLQDWLASLVITDVTRVEDFVEAPGYEIDKVQSMRGTTKVATGMTHGGFSSEATTQKKTPTQSGGYTIMPWRTSMRYRIGKGSNDALLHAQEVEAVSSETSFQGQYLISPALLREARSSHHSKGSDVVRLTEELPVFSTEEPPDSEALTVLQSAEDTLKAGTPSAISEVFRKPSSRPSSRSGSKERPASLKTKSGRVHMYADL